MGTTGSSSFTYCPAPFPYFGETCYEDKLSPPTPLKNAFLHGKSPKRWQIGWRKVLPGSQLVCLPVADGGEGTLETLIHATDGTFYTKKVTGPLGESIHAQYGI